MYKNITLNNVNLYIWINLNIANVGLRRHPRPRIFV